MKYEIKPPRLCCLKLGILEAGTGRLTSDAFTIKYHDMPDVLDFLVLKATYDVAVNRHWQSGEDGEVWVHHQAVPSGAYIDFPCMYEYVHQDLHALV